MSVIGVLEAAAEMQRAEEKKVRHITAEDYEAQKLWREVALILTKDTSYELDTVINFSNEVASAYIKFVNNKENN